MKIHLKGIEHERVEDAPFIGALICAVDCKINCAGCFNQHLKNEPTIIMDSEDIIAEVLSNPFNKGIILSGLEWTLQPEEVRELIKLALEKNLEVILYTGLNEKVFQQRFKDIYEKDIYFKFGNYDKLQQNNNYYINSVKLATSNQKIYKKGIDH